MSGIPIAHMQKRISELVASLLVDHGNRLTKREVTDALETAYIRGWRDAEKSAAGTSR